MPVQSVVIAKQSPTQELHFIAVIVWDDEMAISAIAKSSVAGFSPEIERMENIHEIAAEKISEGATNAELMAYLAENYDLILPSTIKEEVAMGAEEMADFAEEKALAARDSLIDNTPEAV